LVLKIEGKLGPRNKKIGGKKLRKKGRPEVGFCKRSLTKANYAEGTIFEGGSWVKGKGRQKK